VRFRKAAPGSRRPREVSRVFKRFDKNGDGIIDREEIKERVFASPPLCRSPVGRPPKPDSY